MFKIRVTNQKTVFIIRERDRERRFNDTIMFPIAGIYDIIDLFIREQPKCWAVLAGISYFESPIPADIFHILAYSKISRMNQSINHCYTIVSFKSLLWEQM